MQFVSRMDTHLLWSSIRSCRAWRCCIKPMRFPYSSLKTCYSYLRCPFFSSFLTPPAHYIMPAFYIFVSWRWSLYFSHTLLQVHQILHRKIRTQKASDQPEVPPVAPASWCGRFSVSLCILLLLHNSRQELKSLTNLCRPSLFPSYLLCWVVL